MGPFYETPCSLTHNVTLLKCMRKAVYYAKKLSGHFPSVTIFIRPWWKDNNITYFLVGGGWKIASGLLTFPSLGTENSALST